MFLLVTFLPLRLKSGFLYDCKLHVILFRMIYNFSENPYTVSNGSRCKRYRSSARRFRVRGKGAESIPISDDMAHQEHADIENPFWIPQILKKLRSGAHILFANLI